MLRRLIAGGRRASSAGASSSGGEAVASAAEEDADSPQQEPQDNSNPLFDDDESIGDLANPSAVSPAEGAVSTPTTGPTPRRQLPLTAAQNPPTESAAAREASAVASAPVNAWDEFSITVDSDEDWCPSSVGEISDIDDDELEKFLRDCGTQASRLAFIRGVTHLLIDDEKMQQRSAKVNDLSMSRSKSDKAYGVVGNCVNSVVLGIRKE